MNFIKSKIWLVLFLPFCAPITPIYAAKPKNYLDSAKANIEQFFSPTTADMNKVSIQELSKFSWGEQAGLDTLPIIQSSGIQPQPKGMAKISINSEAELTLFDAIHQVLQRRPEITQSIADIAGQGANIDAAKAQYFPQISGGISTADLTTGERGRQLYSLSATQVLYDFGKIKSDINIEEAKLLQEQANTLDSIDDIAYQTANAMVNINRYQEIVRIANQQIKGIARIAEIANLRANAGISSQADPIQAQSNLEAAQSNLLIQETQLKQYQQKLQMLLGYDVSHVKMSIPDTVIRNAGLYNDPEFRHIPKMIAAQAAVQIAKFQKEQTKLSTYPTINIKGSLNQALNGKNPNNNEDDGMYSSVMLEANSNFFQGGALRAKQRSAAYAEQAAKAEVQSVYLDVLDQIRLIREQIDNKQKQMEVLALRKNTTARTKELYQEQYKLGTRTVVDLLNSEQAIHSAAQEIETARYDIYAGLIQYIHVTGRSRDLYQLNNTKIQGVEIQP
ncbi:TolC family outer membrane protein [Acinetobacter towneri]|uniref:TolC family outer membrane protein n=1 Tax=Acinetobacter towneri TaxID=202956 RepID=UPI0020975285|nr:TolC family outer membrane protein [Acinetobacter towneri]MCO8049039.1 TolC family outer membrane protein [Acinetobacter towneri]